jgi:hypothetical protein
MKRIFTLITAVAALSMTASAQDFVKTDRQLKNAVLEEFTGIYCVFCPDGHKRGNEVAALYPGRFVRVHVHTGSYANPKSGDPDFRTDHGSALGSQSGLTGYPAGTINRHWFSTAWAQNKGTGTAMSRTYWKAAAEQVMKDTSNVNVDFKATLDIATRKLSVVVEAYYTGDAEFPTHKLHVALMQDNLPGPQTGGATYNPTNILPDGQYNHQHVFRGFLTGQWGAPISATTKGSLYQKTFTYTVPDDLRNIPFELNNLRVAVYVSEGNQEILTGVEKAIELPANVKTDLETVVLSSFNLADYCSHSYTPKVKVTNKSDKSITDFEIRFKVNGTTLQTKKYTGAALSKDQSTEVTFDAVDLPAGVNSASFTVPGNINGGSLIDVNAQNNQTTGPLTPLVSKTSLGNKVVRTSFEGNAYPNAYIANPSGVTARTLQKANVNGLTWDLGAYGNSSYSLWMDVPTWGANKTVNLYYDKVDFTSATNPGAVFHYSYANQVSGNNTTLTLYVSDNCGATWSPLWSKSGNALTTRSDAGSGYRYFAQADEWQKVEVDANQFKGKSEVIFRWEIAGGSAPGAGVYLDDIRFGDQVLGVDNLNELNSVNIYPNPTSDLATIELELEKGSSTSFEVVDLTGKVVMTLSEDLTAGTNSISLDVSSLTKGVYYINIATEDSRAVKQLQIH